MNKDKIWKRISDLRNKLRQYETRTVDEGYIPSFEGRFGENHFPIGGDNYKIRQEYLKFAKLRYEQIENEIIRLSEMVAPKDDGNFKLKI